MTVAWCYSPCHDRYDHPAPYAPTPPLHRSAVRSMSTTATRNAMRRWMRCMRASSVLASSPSTSAPTSAIASAVFAASARGWWRWNRSRCARSVIRAIYAGDRRCDAGGVWRAAPPPGKLTLQINSANPTVSTASADFIQAADGAGGWEGQVWDKAIEVPCTTLDALVAEHGTPAFAKIDVEGFEDTVLAGLSRPLPKLSFEFTTIQRDVAQRCLDRLASLGNLWLRHCAGREPGADLRQMDFQSRHGRPHRRLAARGELRGRLLCSAALAVDADRIPSPHSSVGRGLGRGEKLRTTFWIALPLTPPRKRGEEAARRSWQPCASCLLS